MFKQKAQSRKTALFLTRPFVRNRIKVGAFCKTPALDNTERAAPSPGQSGKPGNYKQGEQCKEN